MNNLFFRKKSGAVHVDTFIWILLGLGTMVLGFLFLSKSGFLFGGVSKVAACGGTTATKGVCISPSQACQRYFDYGCESYASSGKTRCCSDESVISDAYNAKYCVCYETIEKKIIDNLLDTFTTPQDCQNSCANWCPTHSVGGNGVVASCVGSLEISKPMMCLGDNTCYPDLKSCLIKCFDVMGFSEACSFNSKCVS